MHETEQDPSPRPLPSRRAFIATAVSVVSLIPVSGIGIAAERLAASMPIAPIPSATTSSTLPAGYTLFGPEEAAFVEAVVNVMCPADGLTPNGTDCGLAVYIDRQLSGGFGRGGRMYSHGPWLPGKPQQGYQLPLKPAEFFKAGIAAARNAAQTRYGKSFDQLQPADADAFLSDIASGKVVDERVTLADWFSQLLYPLFQQACFADPIYGGNRDKVFWTLIGYPGLPALHAQDVVQYRGKPYPAAQRPQSIQDFS
jgi:gluconate 2-dehydrogenase gamma chain